MKELLGSIISGLALVWAMYQFFVKRMDDANALKQMQIKNLIENSKEVLEKEINLLKGQLHEQEKEFEKMKLVVHSLTTQTKLNGQSFNETTKRIEKVLDRHESKLDNFGKVIIKD
jgi:hypothetical protein